MKGLVFILLLSYSFVVSIDEDIYFLEKYGLIKVNSYNGIVYLNTEDFQLKDTIHILFNVVNGKIGEIIYYDFDDNPPEDINMELKNEMTPSTTAQTYKKTSTKSEYSLKLYYDIKKQNNGKFLIIRFSYFIGDYLEIEQTRANWAIIIVLIVVAIVLIIIIVICVFYFKGCGRY